MSDDAAFTDFVRTQSRSLFRTAFLLTGDAERAEELLQDTLVRLYPRWPLVQAAESELAYVRRSLVNSFVSSGRRAWSRSVAMADVPEPATSAGRTDAIDQIDDRNELGHLLAALPERQRAALILRYLYDQTDSEIAAAIGCRGVTVRSLVSRGLRTLRNRRPDSAGEPVARATTGGERDGY